MAYEFKFPDVGEGITEGKLVKWTVAVGDSVKTDDPIAEVETDKAVVSIPSPVSGTVVDLLFKDGDMLEVGKVIMHIDDGGAAPAPKVEEPVKEESLVLDVGDKVITEVPKKKEMQDLIDIKAEIQKLESKQTDQPPKPETPVQEVKTPEPVVTPQPTQEVSPVVQRTEGILAMPNVRKAAREQNIDLHSVTPSGNNGQITMQDLGGGSQMATAPQQTPTPQAAPEPVKETPKTVAHVAAAGKDILATPAVRKKARELGIDINTVQGSGEHGRILAEDLTKSPKPKQPVTVSEVQSAPVETSVETLTQDTSVPIEGIRAIIAQRMLESREKTAQVTLHEEVDVSELVELRAKHKEQLKAQGVKLTYLPFFVKAYVAAARKYPSFNALVDDEKKQIVQKATFNVGIAADTPKGLLVPVVKSVEHKSIVALANEINDVAQKAKDGTLSPQEMQGGTFSISSLGNMGGTYFNPIIDYPQTAILGIGKIQKKPVVQGDDIVTRDVVYLSLTFDHRVLDGADAARFMQELCLYLKDPEMMFMEMD